MSFLDYAIFLVYMAAVLSVGLYYFRRNSSSEDFFVAGRNMGSSHVGLSIVATDVGGGFSIGLGGVGFVMGLSGSWLLFTGLAGAWLSAVLIIPRLKALEKGNNLMTYPDFLRLRYGSRVAMLASLISGIGYLGFTGAQMLAGAKLASATIIQRAPFGWDNIQFALVVIAFITIAYTVAGGLKAVIYTDTIQWIVLLGGLILVTIPVTLISIGGISGMRDALPEEHFSLTNISPFTFINWMVTIIPIGFIGTTLYQRAFACRDAKEARRAWFVAGLFEYPVMAFSGVFLGMCARVVFPEAEAELALPMLIRDILPVGVTGLVIAAYFSAIMSTADSCMVASSGNFAGDIIERFLGSNASLSGSIRLSMGVTLAVGLLAALLASQFRTVLDAILYAYSFMVSGLLVPTLGAYFWSKSSPAGALTAMVGGGGLTLLMLTRVIEIPDYLQKLDASFYGIMLSLVLFVFFSLALPQKQAIN